MSRTAVIALLMLTFARAASASEVDWSVKLGEEVDTNPERTVGERSDADVATRLFASVSHGGWVDDRWTLSGSAQVGGRVFASTSDQDMLALQAGGAAAWWAGYSTWLGARASWKDRRERGGFRDYARASAVAEAGLALESFDATVSGGWAWFVYRPQHDLDATGPTASLRLVGRPSRAWTLSAGYGVTWRALDEDRYVWEDDGDVLAFRTVEGGRRDVLHAPGASVRYAHHRVVVELGYQLIRNRSNSRLRSYVRHAVTTSMTFVPFGELMVRGAVTLQRTSWDDGSLSDATVGLDDENRNTVTLTVEHPLGPDWLAVEARWSQYSEAFTGDDTLRFDRSVVYLGLVARRAP